MGDSLMATRVECNQAMMQTAHREGEIATVAMLWIR